MCSQSCDFTETNVGLMLTKNINTIHLVRQIEAQNYGKLTISWDNSILPLYCVLKTSKYVSVCWPH
jgi:hypothetical protein